MLRRQVRKTIIAIKLVNLTNKYGRDVHMAQIKSDRERRGFAFTIKAFVKTKMRLKRLGPDIDLRLQNAIR